MVEPIFFSFHYESDVHRAWTVRNSWVTKHGAAAAFDDKGLREAVKRNDSQAIRDAINRALRTTSITVVLIGLETARRPWVQYEIQRTIARGNALLGINISSIKDLNGKISLPGGNPFKHAVVEVNETGITYAGMVKKSVWDAYGHGIPMYNWVSDNGYQNLGSWINEAIMLCTWS